MNLVKGWRKPVGHALVVLAVAFLAYFSLRAEANLGRQGVQLMLESAPTAE